MLKVTTTNIKSSSGASSKQNVQTVARLEHAALHDRSFTDRLSQLVTRVAGSGPFIGIHVLWFGGWLIVNSGKISGIRVFDPYPFTFLTMIVALEAIFLSLFVLTSQNRLAHDADRRAHLDLQINLLAEQENTMMLRMLKSLCEKHGIKPQAEGDVGMFLENTDLHKLVDDLQKELPGR